MYYTYIEIYMYAVYIIKVFSKHHLRIIYYCFISSNIFIIISFLVQTRSKV